MTSPKFPTLSVPFEWFPLPQEEEWSIIRTPFESGHVETRSRWSKPRRKWTIRNQYLRRADLEDVMGFLKDRQGGADPFYIDNVQSYVWPPYDAPTLSESAGGTRAQRTDYVVITFGDGTDETTESQEAAKTVTANNYLTVTVPAFPPGVSQANIYRDNTTGGNTYVSYTATSGGTWTEFETTVDADSASAQKVLSVAATTGFLAGDTVIINEGGARSEIGTIASISAGISITMDDSLTYTHTAGQADAVMHDLSGGGEAFSSTNSLQEELYVTVSNNPAPSYNSPELYSLELTLVEAF